jgi:hypothetical protein
MAQYLKYATLLTVLSLPLMAAPPFRRARPAPAGASQQPSNPPAEEEKPVKVFTEEILLPVIASDERGRFDPGLTVDDVLVLEEGVPQQVRSVLRLPVNLLLLIDLGGEVPSPLKTTCELTVNPSVAPEFSTCAVARQFIDALGDGDSVAVLQNSGRVEVLQDWTTDRAAAALKVRTRLFTSARSRLAECMSRAAEMAARRPAGNTHIVVITGGAGGGLSADSSALIERLAAAQATLHVISYSTILRESLSDRNFGLDFQMRRRYRRYGEAIKEAEARLRMLVKEVGGEMSSPADEEAVTRQSRAVMNNIKLQYVITYRPARPFGAEGGSERRRVVVGARRVGLRLVSLRDYVTLVRP